MRRSSIADAPEKLAASTGASERRRRPLARTPKRFRSRDEPRRPKRTPSPGQAHRSSGAKASRQRPLRQMRAWRSGAARSSALPPATARLRQDEPRWQTRSEAEVRGHPARRDGPAGLREREGRPPPRSARRRHRRRPGRGGGGPQNLVSKRQGWRHPLRQPGGLPLCRRPPPKAKGRGRPLGANARAPRAARRGDEAPPARASPRQDARPRTPARRAQWRP